MPLHDQRPKANPRRSALIHETGANSEALNEMLGRNRGRLFNTALRLLGNHHDAEDAVQDALLAAYCNRHTFEWRSQFSTWLTRIVVNAALMRLRKERVRRAISIDEKFDQDLPPLAELHADPGPSPEEICAAREGWRLVELELQGLPESHRRAARLHYVQGLKVREAAEAAGLATGSLKSRLHRMRLRLREQADREHGQGTRIWRRNGLPMVVSQNIAQED